MKIPCIVNLSVKDTKGQPRTDENVTRRITVFNGMPMYESSGRNSREAKTWLPFTGLMAENHPLHKNNIGITAKSDGFFMKPLEYLTLNEQHQPPEVFKTMGRTFGWDNNKTDEMWCRFGSVAGLLVSSQMGGGLWETPQGQNFKNYLKASYPIFYAKFPSIEVEQGSVVSSNNAQLNQWIKQQDGKMDGIFRDLNKFMDKLTSTYKHQLRSEKVSDKAAAPIVSLHATSHKSKEGVLERIAKKITGPISNVSDPEFDNEPPKRNPQNK